MASIITATTSSGLTQSADNSGVLQLASGSGNLVTIPAVTGIAMVSGNMPAFSAYQSSAQTLSSNTNTKIQFQTESFDTANAFDSTTNYRFTPQVAGYYQVTGSIAVGTSSTTIQVSIYKNGGEYSRAFQPTGNIAATTSLVYLNGSTDYLEIYGLFVVGQVMFANLVATYFQAVMVRSA